MASPEIRTSAARIWLDDEGILNVLSLGLESSLESVQEFAAAKHELLGDERAALLFDAREWPGAKPAAWKQFVSMLETISSACAVVASPLSIKAMGAFPKAFDDFLVPFRVFEAEEPAREFLRQQLDK